MYQGIPPNPDPTFVKRLHEFDPLLRVQFDKHSERFVVTKRRAYGNDFVVHVIQCDDGTFRPPDMRDIKALYWGDLWRHGGVRERIRSGEERYARQEREQQQRAKDEFRAAAREDKIQLSNTYRKAFNEGSKAPEFRRVDVKSGGLTVQQIKDARAAGRDPWVKAA